MNEEPIASLKIKKFDSNTIFELFGSFDAEQEKLDRFKDYFVTNDFYEQFSANFPLRIVVGNKGAGKSAIIRASQIEMSDFDDHICVPLTASDLIARADDLPTDGLKAINHWKSVFATEALSHIVTSSISEKIPNELIKSFSSVAGFISSITQYASKKTKGISDFAVKAGIDLNRTKRIVFFIDDIDKGWDGRSAGLHFVNSIINACYDISKRDDNIRFRIAIRWDLWDAISRINQDIDKIRQNAVMLRWTNHQIYIIVARRIARFFKTPFNHEMYLSEERRQDEIARVFDPIIERTFHGFGRWDATPTRRVILSMTRNRPRDLLTLLTLAAQEANQKGRTIINSTDLQNVFPRYSEDRLNDLNVEYSSRISGLDGLLLSFKPSHGRGKTSEKFRYTNDRISTHLKEILKSSNGRITFAYEKGIPDYRRILDFLYRIDFLQAWYRNSDGSIERVNFQDRQLAVTGLAEFGYSWEVLPAYRWAIQPAKIQDVIESLE